MGSKAIFIPGYIATDSLYSPWLEKMAKKFGVTLVIHRREYSALLPKRAKDIKKEIITWYNVHKQKLDLVGHSRGGTDLTYTLFKYPELKRLVRSVTTMASPHAGSLLADLALNPGSGCTFKMLNLAIDIMNEEGTVKELTSQFMRELDVQPVEGVEYYSFSFWADKKKMPLPGGIKFFGNTRSDGTVSFSSQWFTSRGFELEACHKSQTLPFLYGPPIIRWFRKPYKRVWKEVFNHLNRI